MFEGFRFIACNLLFNYKEISDQNILVSSTMISLRMIAQTVPSQFFVLPLSYQVVIQKTKNFRLTKALCVNLNFIEIDFATSHRESENEIADSVRKFGREIEDLKFSKSTLERQRETLEGELSASKQEVSGLKGTVAQLTSAQAGLNAEFSATKVKIGTLIISISRCNAGSWTFLILRCPLLPIVNFWGILFFIGRTAERKVSVCFDL